ncbi:MAG TPA: DUF3786 domain-containing protein [Nitrospirota bacterium]|nr:DUF3786 domain-containing protein [Nitrospirota bacterium]
MTEDNKPGEEKAWDILATLDVDDVCRAAAVSYDRAMKQYVVKSLGMNFLVAVKDRTISSSAPGSDVLLKRLGYFFNLSILWYLVSAKDIACTGRVVKLQNVRGGEIFTMGSHILPLDKVAQRFGKDKKGFLLKGTGLGGELVEYGDASVKLYPFPRIPAILTLWLEDEEFPARADLMFDSTCDMHLATDIIWSIAMMCVLAML